jgi:hypothetical protein
MRGHSPNMQLDAIIAPPESAISKIKIASERKPSRLNLEKSSRYEKGSRRRRDNGVQAAKLGFTNGCQSEK